MGDAVVVPVVAKARRRLGLVAVHRSRIDYRDVALMAGVLLEVGDRALGVDQVKPDSFHFGTADPSIRDDNRQVLAELAPHILDQVGQVGLVLDDALLRAVVPALMPAEARDLVVPPLVLGELGAEVVQHALHRTEHVRPHVANLVAPLGHSGRRTPVGLQARPAGRDLDDQHVLVQRIADDMAESILWSVPTPFAESNGVPTFLDLPLRQLSGILLILEDLDAGVDAHVVTDEPLAVAVDQWVSPARAEGFGHGLDCPGQAADPAGDLAAVRRGLRLTRVVFGVEPVPRLAVADHVGLPGEDKDLDRLVGSCGGQRHHSADQER